MLTRRDFMQALAALVGTAAAAKAVENVAPAAGNSQSVQTPVIPKIDKDLEGIVIPAWYYQHFDADYTKSVPELGFGGWKKSDLEFSKTNTAFVVMHAWDAASRDTWPGWYNCAPFVDRANKIAAGVFPPLLSAVRNSGMKLFHVVGGSNGYWKKYPGYSLTTRLCKIEPPKYEQAAADPFKDKLIKFKCDRSFVGAQNAKDVAAGFEHMDFAPAARPLDSEPVAENGTQLFALCKAHKINHLIYSGFAINWCLLLSPGGMAEMDKYGIMCSAVRQATTAVESRESAPGEMAKELALWRVALAFGFVFDVDDITSALASGRKRK